MSKYWIVLLLALLLVTPVPCPDGSTAQDQIGWETLPGGVIGVVWGPPYCPDDAPPPPPTPGPLTPRVALPVVAWERWEVWLSVVGR